MGAGPTWCRAPVARVARGRALAALPLHRAQRRRKALPGERSAGRLSGLRRSGGLGASLRAGPPEVAGGAAERQQVRGGGGCGSAVPPLIPPALCASTGELAPGSGVPQESILAVGIGKSGAQGRQKEPPGFPPHAAPRARLLDSPGYRRLALGFAQATTACQLSILEGNLRGPSSLRWKYLLCAFSVLDFFKGEKGVSLERRFFWNSGLLVYIEHLFALCAC